MKGRKSSRNNLPKDPNEPLKPPKPYTRYSRVVWEQVQSDNPGMNIGQIGNTVGKMWRNLSDSEREVYNKEFQKDYLEYEKNIHRYRKSDEYNSWMAKMRDVRNDSPIQIPNITQTSQTPKPQSISSYSYLEEDRDQSDDDHLTDKYTSFYRYRRNQECMYDLLKDSTPIDYSHENTQGIPAPQLQKYEHEISRANQETQAMSHYHEAKKLKIARSTELFRKNLQEQISWLKEGMNKMKPEASSMTIMSDLLKE